MPNCLTIKRLRWDSGADTMNVHREALLDLRVARTELVRDDGPRLRHAVAHVGSQRERQARVDERVDR